MKNKPELLALIQLIITRTKQIEYIKTIYWSNKYWNRIPKYEQDIEQAKKLFNQLKTNQI